MTTDDDSPVPTPHPAGDGNGNGPRYPWHPGTPAAGTPPGTDAGRPASAEFQGRRAGLVTRVLANALDLGVTLLTAGAGYAAVAGIRFLLHPASFTFPAPPPGVLLLLAGGALMLYFVVAWSVTGRTYGDQVLGLRVVGSRGDPLHWAPAVLRAVLSVLFPIGLFWALVSRENRSVQDVLLRTSVVHDWSVHLTDPGDGSASTASAPADQGPGSRAVRGDAGTRATAAPT